MFVRQKRDQVIAFALSWAFTMFGFADTINVSGKESYTAQLLSCHFPIPSTYEFYSHNDKSVVFVEDAGRNSVSGRTNEGASFGKIERIRNYDRSETSDRLIVENLKEFDGFDVKKASLGVGSVFIYFVDRGSDRIYINDKNLSEEDVIAMVDYCSAHPVN